MLSAKASVPRVTALFVPTFLSATVPEPVRASASPETILVNVVRSALATVVVPLYTRLPERELV